MKTLSEIKDPVFLKKSQYNFLDKLFLSMIKDERDLPFAYLNTFLAITLISSAVMMYMHLIPAEWWFIHPIIHVLIVAAKMGPFTLMLHNTSHRPFMKNEKLNGLIPWILGPFMGQSPMLYYAHHIGMHHSEGNMPEDKSSTMMYQRDSIAGFSHYWFRFLTIGIVDLVKYFSFQNKKKRDHFQWMAVRGELIFWIFCIAMCFVDTVSTIVVFVLPVIAIRSAMMMGNWSQHAFICQNDPENDYKNSITCINTSYNSQCFNDGYHIGHHANPNMHWTDMPGDFLANRQKYIDNDAVVFDGLDYNQIWFFLMTRNYRKLARHFVNLGDRYKNEEEIVTFLKSRTKKFILNQK